MQCLFDLGRLLMSKGVVAALAEARDSPFAFLERHVSGDWGDMCAEDAATNAYAIGRPMRIMSTYTTSNGVRFWISTERLAGAR